MVLGDQLTSASRLSPAKLRSFPRTSSHDRHSPSRRHETGSQQVRSLAPSSWTVPAKPVPPCIQEEDKDHTRVDFPRYPPPKHTPVCCKSWSYLENFQDISILSNLRIPQGPARGRHRHFWRSLARKRSSSSQNDFISRDRDPPLSLRLCTRLRGRTQEPTSSAG